MIVDMWIHRSNHVQVCADYMFMTENYADTLCMTGERSMIIVLRARIDFPVLSPKLNFIAHTGCLSKK